MSIAYSIIMSSAGADGRVVGDGLGIGSCLDEVYIGSLRSCNGLTSPHNRE